MLDGEFWYQIPQFLVARRPWITLSSSSTHLSFARAHAQTDCLRFGLLLLAFLVTLVVWQGSFSFGPIAPSSVEQTYLFWAVSTLIFVLTVTLGFMLFRTALKLYIERQTNRADSHIKSKLIGGALALSFLPVFFLV